MDFQCSFYDPGGAAGSYLDRLREASEGIVYDYHSRSSLQVGRLSARECIRALHERTVLSLTCLEVFNDVCRRAHESEPDVRDRFDSWVEMRNWALDLFQGEGNWAHRGYRGTQKQDLFSAMYSKILDAVPARLGRVLGEIPCCGLFTNDVSAHAISSPTRDIGIIVPWNLLFFLHAGCRFLFACLGASLAHTDGKAAEEDRRCDQVFQESLNGVWLQCAWSCESGPVLFRLPSLLYFDRGYSTLLEGAADDFTTIVRSGLYFVLLHEIGHVVNGHLDSDYLLPMLTRPELGLHAYLTSVPQEREADSFATRHLLGFILDRIPGPTYLKLLGPPFVFALYRMREYVFSRWKHFVHDLLSRKELPRVSKQELAWHNLVTVWHLATVNRQMVQAPVHPPTRERLRAVTDEIVAYAKTLERDPLITFSRVIADRLDQLVERLCGEGSYRLATDEFARESAEQTVRRMLAPEAEAF